MKALLFLPLLLASVVGLFAQDPNSGGDAHRTATNPQSEEAAQLARHFMEKVTSKDYKGAAGMIVVSDADKKRKSSDVLKEKIEWIKKIDEPHSSMGDAVSCEVTQVGEFKAREPYPDSVKISEVLVAVKYNGREMASNDRVSIMKKADGSLHVWRYLD